MLNTVIERASERVSDAARVAAFATASALSNSKRPVKVLAKSGLQLNDIVHETIEALIAQSGKQAERGLDASAKHLKRTVDVDDLPTAIRQQIETVPVAGRKIRKDVMAAMELYRETGMQLIDLAGDTWTALTAEPVTAAKKTTRKVAKKTTKKATRKTTATRKKVAKKATAAKKKVTPRKKTTRRA